jgi:two-component system, cell cycle response regulator
VKILVVDDDPVSRLLLQASLGAAGHRVQEASNGEVAWEMLQRDTFRLVISDWMMPGLDGLELTRRIRAAANANYIYIILLTVKGGKDDVVSGLEAGVDDYLTKPFNPNELRARVAIGERILSLEAHLAESRQQLQLLATHDELTKVLNRRAIYENAGAELQRALRSDTSLSLVLFDMHNFRAVNDQHGHLVGDRALSLVAETLRQNKRPYDLLGRWGGDSFLLVLPDTSAEAAYSVASRLHESVVAAYLPTENTLVQLALHVGVAGLHPSQHVPLDVLLQQADAALRSAKRAGPAAIWVFGDEYLRVVAKE